MISLSDQKDRLLSTKFTINSDIFNNISNLASIGNTTPEYVSVACYIAYMFKLTGGTRDFSIWQNTNTKGQCDIFEPITTLSSRNFVHLDPNTSFLSLIHHINDILAQTIEPQYVSKSSTTNPDLSSDGLVLLNLSFALRSVRIRTKTHSQLQNDNSFGDIHPATTPPFDTLNNETRQPLISPEFSFLLQYDFHENNMTCTFNASDEIFDQATIDTFANRFEILCQQLFSSSFDTQLQPICQLSILLPAEQNLLTKLNNYHIKPNATYCIHQAFVQQALQHPTKLAVILHDQSFSYQELLDRVRYLSWILINDRGIKTGDIVCQYIDRSIDMVVGIMSIMMAGGVYAPLSLADPIDRLQSLVHQVNAKLILVNKMSRTDINSLDVPILDISQVAEYVIPLNDAQIEELSRVNVTSDSISHIVFTSGSTGVPKAVQIRHRNFMDYVQSHIIQTDDVVIQLTSSSFDVHLDEIHGALVRGAQLVMLKPGGQFDFDYVTRTINDKKVTLLEPVPSWLTALGKYLNDNHCAQQRLKSIKCLYPGGETLFSSMIFHFLPFVNDQCKFVNAYGPAEITMVATRYEIHREELSMNVVLPIGYPLNGYRIYLLDEYRQPVIPGQIGEIFIGGVGVFAGYYGRTDLTSQVLIKIDDEECYATGDMGRLDVVSGELYFVGRRDYQVKLRGQRIEVSEIEETIMKRSMFVTSCVVMKCLHDEEEHLVCYVEVPSNKIKEDDLRDQCRSSLGSYMIPSKFIILDRFPLTVNGKVNRKALPPPDFTTIVKESGDNITPENDIEKRIHRLWREILGKDYVPMNRSFFALHGSSLLFMQLYNRYQIEFDCVPNIVTCLRHATIHDHAQLLLETMVSTNTNHCHIWPCLKIDQAKASFAQSRIILDEQIRMSALTENHITVYNIPLLYRLSQGSLLIKQLRRALQQIAEKHSILRTSIQFDPVNGNLMQCIDSTNQRDWFTFCMTFNENDDDRILIEKIFVEEMTNQTYFNVSQGEVCRCHIVRRYSSIVDHDDDLLSIGDWIIFNFHHSAFDGESERIFLAELQQFYSSKENLQDDQSEMMLQYIDYSVHEQQMDMTLAKSYWRQTLLDYNFHKVMNLPFDRKLSPESIRTGRGSIVDIHFERHIVEQLIKYASDLNVTLYQVCLTIYYIFLFKLTGGQQDLIVGIVHANRYRPELQRLIGMFANTLPMRVRVNPQDTFEELLNKVSNSLFEAHVHFHLPYQLIIEQIPMGQMYGRNLIQTMFTLDELSMKSIRLDKTSSIDVWSISRLNSNHSTLTETPVNVMSMFDMSLSLEYTIETNGLRGEFIVSKDLFDSNTIVNIAKRFQLIVQQLFSSLSENSMMMTTKHSIADLSLSLPDEIAEEMNDLQLESLSTFNVSSSSSATASFAQQRIWHEEQINCDPYIAINNMPFFYRLAEGTLSIEHLRRALRMVVQKQCSLRTSFTFDSTLNSLIQRIIEPRDEHQELFTFIRSSFNNDNHFKVIILDELHNRLNFNLSDGRVFRVHIVLQRIDQQDNIQTGDYLIFNFHEMVFDLPSWNIFYQDLCRAYQCETTLNINTNVIRYIDYAIVEQRRIMKVASSFWHEIMFEYDWNYQFNLPVDHQQKVSQRYIGSAYTFSLTFTEHLAKKMVDYAIAENVSLSSLLLTCYYVFLFKLADNKIDLSIGTNVDTRYSSELKEVVGVFTNLIPLRFQLQPKTYFKYCVHRVAKLYHQCINHGRFPYQRILETLQLPSDVYPNLYFDFQTISSDTHLKQSISISPTDTSNYDVKITSKFNMSLTIRHDQIFDTIICTFIGSCKLFHQATIDTFANRFEILCQQLFSSSFDRQLQPICQLSILLPAEQNLLTKLNNYHIKPNATCCIHQAFVQQALQHPTKLAVILDDQSLSYQELLDRVRYLSWILINDQGIKTGDIVCQYIDRSIDMVVGIMSIMMAGCVYAPLNLTDPIDRLQSLVHQVNAKLILVNKMSRTDINSLDVPILDISQVAEYVIPLNDAQIEELSRVNVTSDSISHIVFTSGSTGVPKAVQIRHRNFMDYVQSHIIQTDDVVIQLTSASFDAHLDEIDVALICGAQLVMLKPGGQFDFDYVTRTIDDKKVTFLGPVPSWLNALGKYLNSNHHAQHRVKSVKYWYLGGEALLSSTIVQFLPFVGDESRFFNLYGPAEITIVATRYEIHREELSMNVVLPIGYPLNGYRIYLLDEYRQPVIPGQIGEIFIGGVGVFAGYYGRTDLTSQVLIKIDDEECYATGDIGRLDVVSGELYFVGRRDYQVKLRGQRIELSNIELMIVRSSSNVINCIVLKEGCDDDDHLVAYVQVKENIDKSELRNEIFNSCTSQLPSYMIPTKWIFVLELPLNINGKIDRKKLREIETMEITELTCLDETIKILTPLEKKLQEIFMRAFHLVSPPDVRTPFGLLGGTSVGAMRALNLIQQEMTDKMDITLLFTYSSVQKLAAILEPMINIGESDKEKKNNDDDDNFALRPRPSWLVESVGVVALVWLWLWPIWMTIKFQFSFLPMLLVPFIHLIQYPLFIKLMGGPFTRGRDTLYSWGYYRLWFLRRQWSLNTYWLGHLLGTRFYNSYLRACGARVNKDTHVYTTHIDAPWLLTIGNSCYIGEEVILSSLTYHDRIYELHEIRIGSYCSIGTRCVLHDRVDMQDGVRLEPLTAVTGRIIGKHHDTTSFSILTYSQSIFQLFAIITMFSVHIFILKFAWFLTNSLPLCIGLPISWLIWIVLGCSLGLFLLSRTGNVEQNFSHALNSWTFLGRFWLRQLILNSFGLCLSSAFDGTYCLIPLILRWLGVTIENNDTYIDEIIPMLSIPPNLLTIDDGVTTTSSVRLVPFEVTTYGQCTVTGPIRIGSRSFIANRCLLRAGACVPEDVLVGSLSRIDSTGSSTQKGDILFGIPARPVPLTLSNTKQWSSTMTVKQFTKRALLNDLHTLTNEFINVLLFAFCAMLVLKVTASSNMIIFAVPSLLLIYSSIITIAYVHLINYELSVSRNSQSFDQSRTNLFIPSALSLVICYEKWIGSFLGGTQWLIVVLRRLGAQIDDDVIIEDMNSVEDIHLITIGSHVRLSLTSRIQCHTFEQRNMKFRRVNIGAGCVLKPMSLILPGVTLMGYNHLMPCSVVLPHDQLVAHTDWLGSPARRIIIHHGLEPPQLILDTRQSSLGAYDVVVGRFHDDILVLYFGDNGWLGWQTGIDLRHPFQPSEIWIKLFFTAFMCQPQTNRVLIIGLGGGILPILIRHYFPSIVIDVVEVDETVIEFSKDYFGLAEQMTDGYLNIFAEDAYIHASKTTKQYDIIFMDVFSDETMPTHLNSEQFFINIRNILTHHGCLLTNANLSTIVYHRLTRVLSSIFDANILLAHNNIIENARVIISGSKESVVPISSKEQAIAVAQQLESNTHLEFSISRLVKLAYRGPLVENTSS